MTRLLDLGIFFNFILKFRLVNKFFRSPKKLLQTAGKQVHGMVLIYRLISRQPPFCVFDDIFNLCLSFEHFCLIYDFLSLGYT